MAVSGIKGTGIGQVTIPSAEDVVRGQQQGILDVLGSYVQGLASGTGEKAGEFLPVPDFAPDPQTRLGQLFDIPGLAESAAKGARLVTGAPAVVTKTLGDVLSSPTESAIQDEIKRVESELSPFREELRRQKAAAQAGVPTTPGLGTFTTAGGEETRDQVQPERGSQTDIGIDDEQEADAAGAQAAETPEAATEDIIRTSVQDYLSMTGKETKATTTEEYIKEFADATGLDVSGKPDKSTALMTFGLALMQNKAGKGFDVGKMLGSVGEAGEKAMPAFEKAKSEARALRAKAGEYALGRTREDQAKAQQRENFYIIPKGKLGGPLGVVDAITKGKGEFARLNSFELNDLDTNEEFNRNFEIVKASDYTDLAKEALKTPEAKKLYSDKVKFIPLFSGAEKGLGFNVQLPDANAAKGTKPAFVDNAESVLGQVQQMEQSLNRQEKRFTEIGELLNTTDIDIVSQVGQSVVQGFRNLGIDVGGGTTPITQLKTLLTELKAENAAAILQESGKTLSDNDRKMVASIVGDISYTEGDEEELVRKLGRLYGKIVTAGRRNVDEAYGRIANAGINVNRKNIGNPESQLRKSESDDADYEFVVSGDK